MFITCPPCSSSCLVLLSSLRQSATPKKRERERECCEFLYSPGGEIIHVSTSFTTTTASRIPSRGFLRMRQRGSVLEIPRKKGGTGRLLLQYILIARQKSRRIFTCTIHHQWTIQHPIIIVSAVLSNATRIFSLVASSSHAHSKLKW